VLSELGREGVSHTGYGDYVAGVAGIWLYLGPQPTHESTNQVAVALSGVAPDVLHDGVCGQNLLSVDHQRVEEAEFEVRKAH
jgi:hypothetical protein